LVEVILALHPELRDHLSVPDLEREDFDPRTLLRQPVSPAAQNFDTDVLMQMLTEIVNTSKTKAELVGRLVGIPIEGAKLQFWKKIRELLETLKIDHKQFNEALHRAGLPPGLPVRPGGSTLDCAKAILENPSRLSADQQLIWKVATAVYPPFTSKSDPELKAAGRWLAKYWDRALVFARERWESSFAADLGRRRPQEKTQVFLLSWLELPLVTQTGNVEPGKTGLFELGQFFQGRAGTP